MEVLANRQNLPHHPVCVALPTVSFVYFKAPNLDAIPVSLPSQLKLAYHSTTHPSVVMRRMILCWLKLHRFLSAMCRTQSPCLMTGALG